MQPISDMLSYDRRKLLGQGSFGQVYSGLYNNLLPVAIKRIMKSYTSNLSLIQREIEIMMKAGDHPNITRYFCTEANDDFLFIASELCAGTLQDLIEFNKIESGDERGILYQVTSGLAHLHSLGIVHRNIKPRTILFLNPPGGSKKLQIKIASFSISKAFGYFHEDFSNTSVTNPSGTRGWMAPEMYQSNRCTRKVDTYALGCLFGYTLSGGHHPFGDNSYDREYRIKNMQPMVLTQEGLKIPYSNDDEIAFTLIKSMLECEPDRPTVQEILNHSFFSCFHVITPPVEPERLTMVVNDRIELGFYRKKLLGGGGFASVYTGVFSGKLVAVKRITHTDPDKGCTMIQREVEPMKMLKNRNIVRYLAYTTDSDFLYIVTELCKGTLKDWIAGTLDYDGPKIDDEREILHQVTQGLAYLHHNKIIHRDIKPHNILIYVDEGSEPLMKLADFGICKILSVDNGFTITNVVNPSGTRGYMPPEMLNLESSRIPDGYKVDIFALGCVFSLTLSIGGKHPFGKDEVDQSYLIKEKMPMRLSREELKDAFSQDELAFSLIQSMVNAVPKERPTASGVLLHAFFTKSH